MVKPRTHRALSIVCSPAASVRIEAARRFITAQAASLECLLVAERRDAIDEFARDLSSQRGAVFGWHRFSLRQLAARLAATELARRGAAPATGLNVEAVAARSAFEELEAETLDYLGPVARLRSVARTLSSTLEELRHAHVEETKLRGSGTSGDDLARLAGRYADQLVQAKLVDSAGLLEIAAEAARDADAWLPLDGPLLLLDLEVHDAATRGLVAALAARGHPVLATVAAGDTRTRSALEDLPGAQVKEPTQTNGDDALSRVRQYLFTPDAPHLSAGGRAEQASEVTFFSAPGESRECVEIARAILHVAARGVGFDRVGILLRAPQVYAGLVETALGRAGIPAWFARGTRVPDPAGRAFLALLACAAEQLSARRFSEYLSLAQIPELEDAGGPPTTRRLWTVPANADQVVPGTALPPQPDQPSLFDVPPESDEAPDTDERPVVGGSLRAPWRWDRLLVESAVIGGRDRWQRRLDGLARELQLRREECASDDPESPRVRGIERDLTNLHHLKRFALPVIDRLDALPSQASWSEWLDALETLAPMVLRHPERVLALLGELRPMSRIGPVKLVEVRDVLSGRLTELQSDPPPSRYGRVFVGRPEHARGRAFDVVFVPGLAERIFPEKQRQDPLLLDDARRLLNMDLDDDQPGLRIQDDRADDERLLLQLAVGAATERLYLSYPRLHASESRPRVPSFYALDVERARVGRVPDFRGLERSAYEAAGARLAWPSPVDPDAAIDDTEHDLAVLGPLLRDRSGEQRGRARYLLKLNPGLRRSLLTRWARWKTPWSRFDGLYAPAPDTLRALSAYRPTVKPYSVSALQRFATCPYQFLLSAVYRLEPRREIQPLERMDALTRGRMFHEVQAEFVRELQRREAVPITRARLNTAEKVLDATLDRVATVYYENLAPAIDRVWADEIEAMRTDLKGWVHHVADEDGAWIPMLAEFGFGFRGGDGRDPASVPEPVTLDGRWILHGVVDLVEAKAGPTPEGELRVTDHKTGRNRTRERLVVGHGEVLQPVLYGLAVEAALRRSVGTSRLFFCTVNGEFTTRAVALGEEQRRQGLEVIEIIDRALDAGTLLPAPREGACAWCDFTQICGPWEETRVKRKDDTKLVDLQALRRMP